MNNVRTLFQEEALEMEIFKLKNEVDHSQLNNSSLKETITIKENDVRLLHDRLIDVSATRLKLFLRNSFFLSRLISMKIK